ncbi:Uncharacterised protein [Chryseobacterium nakagawai]|nr:Uncharacterised protein [Chryseobacterium nakagawai]
MPLSINIFVIREICGKLFSIISIKSIFFTDNNRLSEQKKREASWTSDFSQDRINDSVIYLIVIFLVVISFFIFSFNKYTPLGR